MEKGRVRGRRSLITVYRKKANSLELLPLEGVRGLALSFWLFSKRLLLITNNVELPGRISKDYKVEICEGPAKRAYFRLHNIVKKQQREFTSKY
jgi:hypothetical protein